MKKWYKRIGLALVTLGLLVFSVSIGAAIFAANIPLYLKSTYVALLFGFAGALFCIAAEE